MRLSSEASRKTERAFERGQLLVGFRVIFRIDWNVAMPTPADGRGLSYRRRSLFSYQGWSWVHNSREGGTNEIVRVTDHGSAGSARGARGHGEDAAPRHRRRAERA